MQRGKILLIENNITVARSIGKFLTAKGYQVIITTEGKKAIDAALREQPDVIVNGRGLKTRKDNRGANGHDRIPLPIQFITGHTVAMNYQRALDSSLSLLAYIGNTGEIPKETIERLPYSFDDPKQPESGQA